MWTAVGQSLVVAVALLLATLPVVLVTLVLATRRPPRVSWGFLGGWVLGLAIVGGTAIALVDVIQPGGPPPRWAGVAKVVLGVLLIVLAVRKWAGRPRDGTVAEMPGWMATVGSLTAAKATGLAFLLAAASPKNALIVVAAGVAITDATSRVPEQAVALAVFVAVGSLGVAAPAIVRQLLGERSTRIVDAADRWMTRNSALVMAAVLVVLGALLLADGLAAL